MSQEKLADLANPAPADSIGVFEGIPQVIGPGGTLGVLQALISCGEKKAGKLLRPLELGEFLLSIAEKVAPVGIQTDASAMDQLKARTPFELSIDELHSLPPERKMWIRGEMLDPRVTGCGFFRAVLKDPVAYGLRSMLPGQMLEQFWKLYFEHQGKFKIFVTKPRGKPDDLIDTHKDSATYRNWSSFQPDLVVMACDEYLERVADIWLRMHPETGSDAEFLQSQAEEVLLRQDQLYQQLVTSS